MMDWQTMYEVVTTLNGGIEPLGDSTWDEMTYKNLETLMDLTDELIKDICHVARCAARHEWSMAKAGKAAQEWLRDEAWFMIDVAGDADDDHNGGEEK